MPTSSRGSTLGHSCLVSLVYVLPEVQRLCLCPLGVRPHVALSGFLSSLHPHRGSALVPTSSGGSTSGCPQRLSLLSTSSQRFSAGAYVLRKFDLGLSLAAFSLVYILLEVQQLCLHPPEVRLQILGLLSSLPTSSQRFSTLANILATFSLCLILFSLFLWSSLGRKTYFIL